MGLHPPATLGMSPKLLKLKHKALAGVIVLEAGKELILLPVGWKLYGRKRPPNGVTIIWKTSLALNGNYPRVRVVRINGLRRGRKRSSPMLTMVRNPMRLPC